MTVVFVLPASSKALQCLLVHDEVSNIGNTR